MSLVGSAAACHAEPNPRRKFSADCIQHCLYGPCDNSYLRVAYTLRRSRSLADRLETSSCCDRRAASRFCFEVVRGVNFREGNAIQTVNSAHVFGFTCVCFNILGSVESFTFSVNNLHRTASPLVSSASPWPHRSLPSRDTLLRGGNERNPLPLKSGALAVRLRSDKNVIVYAIHGIDGLPFEPYLLRPRDVLCVSFPNISLGCAIGV